MASNRKIQDADVKGSADLTSDARLINDTKIYVTANSLNKRLDQAITNGDFAGTSTAYSSSNELTNLGLATSVSSNALTVALKQAGGTDPASGSGAVKAGFRNATAATGQFTDVSVTAALSLTVASGATLGTANGVTHYIYIYLLNNAGAAEMAISMRRYDDGSIQSSTALSGSSNSNRTLYSTTARTNVGVRLVGRIKISETTAGTWASNATEVSLQPFQDQIIYGMYRDLTNSSPLADGSDDIVEWKTKVFDSHNQVTGTGTSWRINMIQDGLLEVDVLVVTNSVSWTAGNLIRIRAQGTAAQSGAGGSDFIYSSQFQASVTQSARMQGTYRTKVVAGDTFAVSLFQNRGATTALTQDDNTVWISWKLTPGVT